MGWPKPSWVTIDINNPQKVFKVEVDIKLLEEKERIRRINERVEDQNES